MIRDILKQCGYPENVVVLDAETYFDAKYKLGPGGMTLYEYVTDPQFELLGWAVKYDNREAQFFTGLPDIDWKSTTVIMHNAPFDALVLAIHNKLFPPYIVDTLDLARHVESRWKNGLADLCTRHGLPNKGDTKQFSGMHREDFNAKTWMKLLKYATNDADRTYDLLEILLPKLSNSKFELRVMEYTRNLFIRPVLNLDLVRAEELKGKMTDEVDKTLREASWILDYAD